MPGYNVTRTYANTHLHMCGLSVTDFVGRYVMLVVWSRILIHVGLNSGSGGLCLPAEPRARAILNTFIGECKHGRESIEPCLPSRYNRTQMF